MSTAKGLAGKLDIVGAVVALVTGILLIFEILSIDLVVGIILTVVGILALMRSV